MKISLFGLKPIFRMRVLIAALVVVAPTPALAGRASNAEVLQQLEALSRRVQELEQKLAERDAPRYSDAVRDKNAEQRISVPRRELPNEETTAKTKVDADQKARSSPTFYGKINLALERRELQGAENIVAGNAQGAPINRTRLESFSSRLGVKGEAELTNDLQVVYQAEYEINVDNGDKGGSSTSTSSVTGDDWVFSQRNTFAGLKSTTWGQILAGKIDTPFKSAEGKFDQFNDSRGDMDALIGGQNRASKTFLYSTPKFFDVVTANIAVIDAEGVDVDYDGHLDDGIGDSYSASVVAEQDMFYGALAYDRNVIARRSIDESLSNNPATAPIGFAKQYTKAYRAVGTLKSGIWEAGVLLQHAEGLGPDAIGSPAAATNNRKRADQAYLLSSAVYVLPKIKLKAQYGISNGDFSNEKGRLLAFGADYSFLSKTKLYTYYSNLKLDKADVSDKTVAVGLDHSF